MSLKLRTVKNDNMLQKLLRNRNPKIKVDEKISFLTLFWFVIYNAFGFIRYLFYLLTLKIKGTGLIVIKSGFILNGPKINIGSYTIIEENVRIKTLSKNSIYIGKSCRLGYCMEIQSGLQLSDPTGIIKIENNVAIGAYSHIGGAGSVLIGNNCIIGPYFSVHSENHSFELEDGLFRNQKVKRLGIVIGENCWIGAKVTVLDGVTIGNNSVIAAGSVVTKSFSDGVLLAGVPAKVIRKL